MKIGNQASTSLPNLLQVRETKPQIQQAMEPWKGGNCQWRKTKKQQTANRNQPTSGDCSALAASATWCRTRRGGRSRSSGSRRRGRGSPWSRRAGRCRQAAPTPSRTGRTRPHCPPPLPSFSFEPPRKFLYNKNKSISSKAHIASQLELILSSSVIT